MAETLTAEQLKRLMDETRPSRARLLNHAAGADVYGSPMTIYRPLDTEGNVAIERTAQFDHALFAHDLHVTTHVCNEALGLIKSTLLIHPRPTPRPREEESAPSARDPND